MRSGLTATRTTLFIGVALACFGLHDANASECRRTHWRRPHAHHYVRHASRHPICWADTPLITDAYLGLREVHYITNNPYDHPYRPMAYSAATMYDPVITARFEPCR